MNERTPRDTNQTAAWSVDPLAEHMEQTPKPLHVGEGVDGYGFKVIDPEDTTDARTIGIFPDQQKVLISTPDIHILIKNAATVAAKDGIQVTSESGDVRALFLKDGHIAVEIFPSLPSQPVERPLMAENRPDEEISALPDSPRPGATDDENRASQQPVETPITSEQKERQPRVKFTGRLGATPHWTASYDGPRILAMMRGKISCHRSNSVMRLSESYQYVAAHSCRFASAISCHP